MFQYLYSRRYGSSYFHQTQPIGTLFSINAVAGYYNDMRCKSEYTGPVSSAGVPLKRSSTGTLVELPVSATQMALGLHDRWLSGGNEVDKLKFLALADYLMDIRKTTNLGAVWLYNCDFPIYDLQGPFISAMGQGEAISVLVRAYNVTQDERYLDTAIAAAQPMTIHTKYGGVGFDSPFGWWLEEYPSRTPSLVLNGCIFALWGLLDLAITGDRPATELYNEVVQSIVRALPNFDYHGWSRYDMYPFSIPHLASPFYHELHIAQLSAMSQLTPEPIFDRYRERWSQSSDRRLFSNAALAQKSLMRFIRSSQIRISQTRLRIISSHIKVS